MGECGDIVLISAYDRARPLVGLNGGRVWIPPLRVRRKHRAVLRATHRVAPTHASHAQDHLAGTACRAHTRRHNRSDGCAEATPYVCRGMRSSAKGNILALLKRPVPSSSGVGEPGRTAACMPACSPGGAADSSPRREPWVKGGVKGVPAPEGRQSHRDAACASIASAAPPGLGAVRAPNPHGLRRGLFSCAPPGLRPMVLTSTSKQDILSTEQNIPTFRWRCAGRAGRLVESPSAATPSVHGPCPALKTIF